MYSILDKKDAILRSSHILVDGSGDFGQEAGFKGKRAEGQKDGEVEEDVPDRKRLLGPLLAAYQPPPVRAPGPALGARSAP